MYYFDGEFSSKPQQNFGGASKKLSREQLLQKNQEERRKRENSRQQNKAAIKIQIFFKSYLFKKKLFIKLRENLDLNYLANSNIEKIEYESFNYLTRNFLFSYNKQKDGDNLNILSHFFIKNKEYIFTLLESKDSSQWLFRLKKLILINLENLHNYMFQNNIQSSTNFIPLRLLEVFTSEEFYLKKLNNFKTTGILTSVFNFLVKNNFFKFLRKIIEIKIPAPYDESVPFTPLESNLFELILRPLNHEYNNLHNIIKEIIVKFFNQFLIGPFSPIVQYHAIKLLKEKRPKLLRFDYFLNILKLTDNNQIIIPKDCWSLYSLLSILSNQIENANFSEKLTYLFYIKNLIIYLPNLNKRIQKDDSDDEDFCSPENSKNNDLEDATINELSKNIIDLLNKPSNVNVLNSVANSISNENIAELLSLSTIGYSVLINNITTIYENRLLYTLAFNSKFLKQLWHYITTVTTTETNILLIQLIAKGISLTEWNLILPHFSFFCSLFNYLLPTNDDFEFYDNNPNSQKKFSTTPFNLNELRFMVISLRDVSLGLIELAYRDNKLTLDYKNAITNNNVDSISNFDQLDCEDKVKHWSFLFKCVVSLLRQLHNRNSRQKFSSEDHWISNSVSIPVEKPINFKLCQSQLDRYERFVGLKKVTKKQLEELGPPIPTSEIKNITILKEVPFVIPFTDRVKILQKLIEKDKQTNYGESHHFMIPGSTIDIVIRRNYIYEDAFEKLSIENEPDIKKHIRVQLKNTVGLDEAGIDGGGLFREFLNELMKSAFDLNRGFFKSTVDRTLYPNPSADLIVDNYLTHFFFIGRIFGKAIYENMLTELPFSHFFLAKLLTKNQSSDIDIHYLASLDPLMYKNLLYLKNYQGDVTELDLDFTIVQSELGNNKLIELKPNGANIPVTNQNRIEYIHLMADYILNKQIRPHVSAFKQGLANCVNLDWIRMFDARELQILITGAQTPIDLEDLKKHTSYSGGYSPTHLTIINFWKAVETFNENQKSQLLKFVTSCSRPPLLGFRHLTPSFTIQFAGKEDRLPTASTCMNLLKLPEFTDWKIIKQKLIYAIESGVGFELS